MAARDLAAIFFGTPFPRVPDTTESIIFSARSQRSRDERAWSGFLKAITA